MFTLTCSEDSGLLTTIEGRVGLVGWAASEGNGKRGQLEKDANWSWKWLWVSYRLISLAEFSSRKRQRQNVDKWQGGSPGAQNYKCYYDSGEVVRLWPRLGCYTSRLGGLWVCEGPSSVKEEKMQQERKLWFEREIQYNNHVLGLLLQSLFHLINNFQTQLRSQVL